MSIHRISRCEQMALISAITDIRPLKTEMDKRNENDWKRLYTTNPKCSHSNSRCKHCDEFEPLDHCATKDNYCPITDTKIFPRCMRVNGWMKKYFVLTTFNLPEVHNFISHGKYTRYSQSIEGKRSVRAIISIQIRCIEIEWCKSLQVI